MQVSTIGPWEKDIRSVTSVNADQVSDNMAMLKMFDLLQDFVFLEEIFFVMELLYCNLKVCRFRL